MHLLGLIGNPLGHSLSAEFFTKKFREENFDEFEYRLFPLKQINELHTLISANPSLIGLNVTIPYKQEVLAFIDRLDPIAETTGAVNCIRVSHKEDIPFLEGFNTDVYGFENALDPKLKPHHKKALILGTGGSSKAVAYVLKKRNIDFLFVSRNPVGTEQIGYDVSGDYISHFHLIINTSPVGMFPDVRKCPSIPYELLSNKHLLFDLVYNPEMTLFLQKGSVQGASVVIGINMFMQQALASWQIWERGIKK